MNLYLISQSKNKDWDTFDSAVVCAETEEEARMTHPSPYDAPWDGIAEGWSNWCNAEDVKVELIGEALSSMPKGIVLGSFNAG